CRGGASVLGIGVLRLDNQRRAVRLPAHRNECPARRCARGRRRFANGDPLFPLPQRQLRNIRLLYQRDQAFQIRDVPACLPGCLALHLLPGLLREGRGAGQILILNMQYSSSRKDQVISTNERQMMRMVSTDSDPSTPCLIRPPSGLWPLIETCEIVLSI